MKSSLLIVASIATVGILGLTGLVLLIHFKNDKSEQARAKGLTKYFPNLRQRTKASWGSLPDLESLDQQEAPTVVQTQKSPNESNHRIEIESMTEGEIGQRFIRWSRRWDKLLSDRSSSSTTNFIATRNLISPEAISSYKRSESLFKGPILLDWSRPSAAFNYINYKSLESLLSLYPEAKFYVMMLAPQAAQYYKFGDHIR
jgi:hypothetical protein